MVMSSFNMSVAETTSEMVLYESIESEIVTTGLTYEKKSKLTEDGWVDIYVLKMDLTNEYIDIDILRSATEWGAKETISNMANTSEENVVAGINASFFDMTNNPTDIIGPEYEGDYASLEKYYNLDSVGAGSLIETSNELFFDFFSASFSLTYGDNRELYIKGVNRVTDFSAPIIFNTVAIENTASIDALASLYKVVVEEGIVTYVAGIDESIEVPENGYIIAINEDIAAYHIPYFEIGTQVNLEINNNLGSDDIELVISGGGKILEDGQIVETGLIIEPGKRHPRSAIGITEDEQYLIAMVVDGRGESIGATHEELANYLLEYNVSDAIHMDGGGSSTLVSRELGEETVTVNNTPSGGTERKVANGLGFVSLAPEGELYELKLVADTERVFVNMPVNLEVIGYDEYYNPIEINEEDIFWGVQGVTGIWSDLSYTPITAGEGRITCYYEGQSATVTIISTQSYIDLDIYPETVYLDEGETATFTITGTDEEGYKGEVSQEAITWQVSNSAIGSFLGNQFMAGGNVGVTKISASAGDREVFAYVVVGSEYNEITSFENTTISAISYPTTSATGSAIAVDPTAGIPSIDGSKSVALNYEMSISGQTQAVYAQIEGVTISEEIPKIGLNVYGDNSGIWLKAKVIDSEGVSANITFSSDIDWLGWEFVEAELPSNLVYPITLERIYVASLLSEENISSTIYFDLLQGISPLSLDGINKAKEAVIDDPLLVAKNDENAFSISLFGQTGGRDRLLDEVVLNKVYETVADDDVTIFAGESNVSASKVAGDLVRWKNEYTLYDYNQARVICLATDEGGLVDTDANQWLLIEEDLASTVQSTIIIVANESPVSEDGFSDDREGELLHSLLSEFQQKSGKTIFYIDASGYDTGIDYYEGIRYIDLNGLWYTVTDENQLDLYNTFYYVDFYFNGSDVTYSLNNLYSKVEIQ
jgi:hypothetical protein